MEARTISAGGRPEATKRRLPKTVDENSRLDMQSCAPSSALQSTKANHRSAPPGWRLKLPSEANVAIEIKRGHAQFIKADRGGRAELILKGEVPYIPDPHGVETRMRSAWTASGSRLAAQHNFLSP